MQTVDWIIVAVIGLSALLSLVRGFTREFVSLAAWILAVVGARLFAPSLAAVLPDWWDSQAMQELCAFAILFVLIIGTGMLLGHLLGQVISASASLSITDRLLGTAFGAVRGVIIVLVALTFSAQWLSGEGFWRQSQLIPHFMIFEGWTREAADESAAWIGGRVQD